MPPIVALFACLIFMFLLIRHDPAKNPQVSGRVWIPLAWMFFLSSRLPSHWFGYYTATTQAEAYAEGNSLDRLVYLVLIIASLVIVSRRSINWGEFFRRNLAIVCLLALALLSVIWSDFPFIAFKRWFRDLGGYLMITVVLSETQPFDAMDTLLRRLFYLVIPLSV